MDRHDVIGLDTGQKGKGACLCSLWIGKLSDKQWEHLKGSKEQGCVLPVAASPSLQGLPPSLRVFLLCPASSPPLVKTLVTEFKGPL